MVNILMLYWYIGRRYNGSSNIVGKKVAENENIVLTEAVCYILLSLIKPNPGYGIMKDI